MLMQNNKAASADSFVGPVDQNRVSLLIGGKTHREWSSYDIDSDLLIPADAWQVELGLPEGIPPPELGKGVKAGALVEVKIGNDTVMKGFVDDIVHNITHGQHTLSMSGRDQAGILLDCSAPIFTKKQCTLQEIVDNVVKELSIKNVVIRADKTVKAEKVNVEPGASAWDTLVQAAEANGLWPWFEPDGTLVVGGPDYNVPESATLLLRKSGTGNNVISLSMTDSVSKRYSEVTVLGQSHGTAQGKGKNNLKNTEKDEDITIHRPRIVIDPDVENDEMARTKARKLIADSRLEGFTLTAVVKGHRNSDGVLWNPGQRIHVVSEPHGLDRVFFLMARKFQGGRGQGTTTTLTLKEDGVWVLDAKPSAKANKDKTKQPKIKQA